MADRADYLPASRLQELAQQVDPRVKLDVEAEQVRILWRLKRAMMADQAIVHRRSCRMSPTTLSKTSQHLRASLPRIGAARFSRQRTYNSPSVRVGLDADARRPCAHSICAHTAEKNYNMRLVGVGDHMGELKDIKKTTATDAHKARLADVRRSKQQR